MCVVAQICRSTGCTLKDPTDFRSRMKAFDVGTAGSRLDFGDRGCPRISDGIERLLKTYGYRVVLTNRESPHLKRPDVTSVNWTGFRPSSPCRASHTSAFDD